uniref:Uncharacterized protein n=1 Tax=Wuchereria bancrofti TaxID=6293 RepID=A0AAF5RY11_WUCBA
MALDVCVSETLKTNLEVEKKNYKKINALKNINIKTRKSRLKIVMTQHMESIPVKQVQHLINSKHRQRLTTVNITT